MVTEVSTPGSVPGAGNWGMTYGALVDGREYVFEIQDADFAAETASLTKAQILQQAGVAVLSQANAQPQLALSLLQ